MTQVEPLTSREAPFRARLRLALFCFSSSSFFFTTECGTLTIERANSSNLSKSFGDFFSIKLLLKKANDAPNNDVPLHIENISTVIVLSVRFEGI